MRYYRNFAEAIRSAKTMLDQYGEDVDPGHWQGVSTEGKPDLITREVTNWAVSVPIDQRPHGKPFADDDPIVYLVEQIQPNLPWADDHFWERVSREPTNPGEAYKSWPWWNDQDQHTMTRGQFTHTYQERFWPRHAGDIDRRNPGFHMGIRYSYGDLDDLIMLLHREPMTRQAYLPIFFPEDTGAAHGGRIPCTLGYQFLLRDNELHMWYFIRSCDYVRHFRDDIYLACRLLLWVLYELQELELRSEGPYDPQPWQDVEPGYLNMTVCSLHYHKGDLHHVRGF